MMPLFRLLGSVVLATVVLTWKVQWTVPRHARLRQVGDP